MGYGWNWDRCAAMAMAAGPEETLVSGYWSTVAQRSLWMKTFRKKLISKACKYKTKWPKTQVLDTWRKEFDQIPCRYEIAIRMALPIQNTPSTANKGPNKPPDGCLINDHRRACVYFQEHRFSSPV